jgi:toxin YhaV
LSERPPFATRNGWALYQLPSFAEQLEGLVAAVERLREDDPESAAAHPKAKLLKRVLDLILDEIPADPADKAYRQGLALGDAFKDWSRAKFLGRFRLFFRFSSRQRIIIYCWINDENTLRKVGTKSDPYAVFAKMLRAGNPPSDWEALLRAAKSR